MTKLSLVQGIEKYKTPVTLGDGVVTITEIGRASCRERG